LLAGRRALAFFLIGALILIFADPAPTFAQAWVRQVEINTRATVRKLALSLKVEHSAGAISAMDLSPDGRYLVHVAADFTPRLWDLEAGRQVGFYSPLSSPARLVRFIPGGLGFLTVAEDGEVLLWKTRRRLAAHRYANLDGRGTSLAISKDGTRLAIGTSNGAVHVIRMEGNLPTRTLRAHQGPVTWVEFGVTGPIFATAGADGTAKVWEAASGVAVNSRKLSRGPLAAVKFGKDETDLFALAAEGGVIRWRTDVGTDAGLVKFEGAAGAIERFEVSTDASTVLASAGTRLHAWRAETPARPAFTTDHGAPVSAVGFDLRAGRGVTAGGKGLIKFWDLESKKHLVSMISTMNGWAVVDDDGRFDGSNRALKFVQWAADTAVLPIENFSDEYYEPGLLQKKRLGVLQLISAGAPSLKEGILLPPVVKIEPFKNSTLTERAEITVRLLAIDQGGGIRQLRLFHNGKIVDPDQITDHKKKKNAKGRDSWLVTFRVRPVSGRNIFLASASGDQAIFGVTARAALMVKVPPRNPTLHVVAIGINNYKESVLKLNYAIPDANGIARALEKNVGAVFRDIRIHKIFDKQAIRNNILKTLEGLGDTDPEDVVVIYMAGHGDSFGKDFYMLPYEFPMPLTESSLERHGLGSEALRRVFSRIKARRLVMLIDACKSGTAVKRVQDYLDRKSLHRLGAAVGMYIVSATAKEQFAVELSTLGHGAFTYAMIQGLIGKADVAPADKTVTIQELVDYAEISVPEISGEFAKYRHWPMVFSSGLDFTMVRISPPR